MIKKRRNCEIKVYSEELPVLFFGAGGLGKYHTKHMGSYSCLNLKYSFWKISKNIDLKFTLEDNVNLLLF